MRLARGRAHALTEGKCWRFYPPAAPLQAALQPANGAGVLAIEIDDLPLATGTTGSPSRAIA